MQVHDDLDRAFGKYSWKRGGSASGHNGVRSTIASLGSDKFQRLRVGIGRPENRGQVSNFVLSDFSQVEAAALRAKHIATAVDTITTTVLSDSSTVATEPNGLSRTKSKKRTK